MGYSGLTVDFCRTIDAKVIVRGIRVFSDFEYEFRMALANHRLAPEIEVMALITAEEHTFLSSSTVREIASLGGDVSSMVPPHVEIGAEKTVQRIGRWTATGSHDFTAGLRQHIILTNVVVSAVGNGFKPY